MKSERLSKAGKRAVGRGVVETAKRRLMNLFLTKSDGAGGARCG